MDGNAPMEEFNEAFEGTGNYSTQCHPRSHRSPSPEPKAKVSSTSNVNVRWALQMSRSE